MDNLSTGAEPAPRSLRGFLRHLARALLVMLTISALTFSAEWFHLLEPINRLALDLLLAFKAPRDSPNVIIVTINDDDYRELFGARSPLDPDRLRSLLETVLSANPAAVGVDVLTAEPTHARLASLTDPRLVWLQDAWTDADEESDDAVWTLSPVLGSLQTGSLRTGLGQFRLDASGNVRRYFRQRELRVQSGRVTRPSLAWALVETYCGQPTRAACKRVGHDETTEPMRFNFAGDRYSFRKISAGAVQKIANERPALGREFENAIVLVGGTFRAGRDDYRTPLGRVSGLDLTAFAIESELAGGGIRDAGFLTMALLDLVSGVILVWLNWRWPPVSALGTAMNVGAIVMLTLLVSYLSFASLEHWVSFVPVGIGIWLHELYGRAREHRHDHRQLALYRRRYGPL